jgi:DNA-binding NarL/FixJ family response regulator
VEILLAGGLKAEARRAAEELQTIASALGTPYIRAIAARAMGGVLMAEGDAKGALAELRSACEHLHEIEAPYEAARVSVLLGLACRQMGDADSGRLELEAARRVFRQLGASPDLAAVDELLAAVLSRRDSLTSREIEVLRLVASGRTNRAIADELSISEKTVARHLSNIFTKLDLPSRAAATAYAFQHRIV